MTDYKVSEGRVKVCSRVFAPKHPEIIQHGCVSFIKYHEYMIYTNLLKKNSRNWWSDIWRDSQALEENIPFLCDIVCQLLAAGQWFSPDTPISSTKRTDRHDRTEILLKVALNAITQTLYCWLFN